MRKYFVLVAACAVCNTAGVCNIQPEDSEIRAELSKAELEAEPGYHQMKGAILNDVRIWRGLEHKLEDPAVARRVSPEQFTLVNSVPTCGVDQTAFEIYTLKSDLADQPYRIEETAYLCRKEAVYYYHYQGGPRKLDVWMGPYRIDRRRPKSDER